MPTPNNSVFVIVDVQGKLAHSMHNKEHLFESMRKVIKGAQILKVPILLTEQNPTGLGSTIPEVAGLLTDLNAISQFSFSCCDNDRFMKDLEALAPKNVFIAGIETQICVDQTTRDLVNAKYEVEILADAVSSRTLENKHIGLEKCKHTGAKITSVETVLFELLKSAEKSEFKEILNLVK